jgi:hypothetical protein
MQTINLNLHETAKQFEDFAKKTISKSIVPYITKTGIVIGSCLIVPSAEGFIIKRNKVVVGKTMSKSAAMIIAALMNKQVTKTIAEEIKLVSTADMISFSSKNDLEIFKYHYTLAEKKNDETRKALMECRFSFANERYQQAKNILKKSYMNLF